jgi:hypothetical protein
MLIFFKNENNELLSGLIIESAGKILYRSYGINYVILVGDKLYRSYFSEPSTMLPGEVFELTCYNTREFIESVVWMGYEKMCD